MSDSTDDLDFGIMNDPFCDNCIYLDTDDSNICDSCDDNLSNFESIKEAI